MSALSKRNCDKCL